MVARFFERNSKWYCTFWRQIPVYKRYRSWMIISVFIKINKYGSL